MRKTMCNSMKGLKNLQCTLMQLCELCLAWLTSGSSCLSTVDHHAKINDVLLIWM